VPTCMHYFVVFLLLFSCIVSLLPFTMNKDEYIKRRQPLSASPSVKPVYTDYLFDKIRSRYDQSIRRLIF